MLILYSANVCKMMTIIIIRVEQLQSSYVGISIKRIVCLSVSVYLNAFAQFTRYKARTSQAGRGLSGKGRAGVDNFMVPQGAQE